MFLMRFGVLILGLSSALLGATSELQEAERLYKRTAYEASLKLLLPLTDKDGVVNELIGRNYFMLADYKKATDFLEKAVEAEPGNSDYYHWLGKAFGRRAETSSPFTAPGYAAKTRRNFEKAVELDPNNREAVNDLFEYYLEAPGFLGGGLDKAANLASSIAQADPAEGHYAQARLAEKRKEFGKAEQQLRRAVDLAPQQVGRVIDLAKFLAKQGRYVESDQTFQRAERIAPDSPKLLFERADAYIHAGRNIDTARSLLKRYLAAQLTPDDPPRSEAKKLLQKTPGS